ncbi:uncharacterized protein si:dkey-211g8.8 isoform X2 [Coregonus clupeaformis]|uniref:uncharacterized protein si:dkey-211g8.8 isoform X1 n=1 Tax=Coregonus clupeaformis TaxID=59861 RepID=UPI001E1C71B9|nr:uncharacterized protein si:dkey-211g8.8 isoform X1 [Coregonus clupeaformis]XP_045063626.1 uncharacterized protein si:dkey-211g8.8 isoform X2 [Coregonus clupeaformis]
MGDNEDRKGDFDIKVLNCDQKCINILIMVLKYFRNKVIQNNKDISTILQHFKNSFQQELAFLGPFDENTVFKKITFKNKLKKNKLKKSNYVIYITSLYDYINVIFYFWNGKEMLTKIKEPIYIISGCYISIIDNLNFYIKTELRINDRDIESAIEEGTLNVSDIVQTWSDLVRYSTLDKNVSKDLEFSVALWDIILGNQEQLLCITNHNDITALNAVSLSEVIRNPIMIFINLIAIKMDILHSWIDFRKYLPPLAGGTWENQQEYCEKFIKRLKDFFKKHFPEDFLKSWILFYLFNLLKKLLFMERIVEGPNN